MWFPMLIGASVPVESVWSVHALQCRVSLDSFDRGVSEASVSGSSTQRQPVITRRAGQRDPAEERGAPAGNVTESQRDESAELLPLG
jgi:hypothetical protein